MDLPDRGGQMGDQRFIAVADLQQQVVGDFPRTARCRVRHASRQCLRTMVQQALKLGQEAGEQGRNSAEQYRRNIGLIQHHRAVGTHLRYAGKPHRDVARPGRRFQRETQAQLADGHRRDGLVTGIGVDRLMLADGEAGRGFQQVGGRGFHRPGLAGRQDTEMTALRAVSGRSSGGG